MQTDKRVSWKVSWLPTTNGVNSKTVPQKPNTHLPSHPFVIGEIFGHNQLRSLVFASPTGYMLTSFGFSILI
jgi:hypothetical protein